MKIQSLAVCWVALVWPMTAEAQAPVPAETKKTAPKADAKAAPAAPAKKDDKKKKVDEVGKIEGLELARGAGFLGLQIVNGTFKLTVYDAKKKPTAADFTRVAFRWEAPYQKAPERTLLMPGAGVGVFSSEKVVRPPHSFRLYATLIKGDGPDAPVENLVIEFRN
jgi:hypothetical protein